MLGIDNISLHFGDRAILRDVTLTVGAGERLALVGPNGAGKSTLLKVCAGEIRPDGGTVHTPKDAAIGYLPQDVILPGDRPLLDEVMSVFDEAHRAMAEMRELEHRMAEVDHASEEFEKIAARYDHLQHDVLRMDAYSAEARAAQILHGLGFRDDEMQRPCGDFSGGWQMRAELAKVLLATPDILLLDEPTNYLDIETMLWLENWLRASDAAILFVSHERAFMDNLAQRVVEIAAGQYHIYRGNYSRYLEQREERRKVQQAAWENQQTRIKQIEDFAAKFRAQARRASGVQSRLKEIDRMEKVEPPPPDPKTIRFTFPPAPRSNKLMVHLDGVTKRYGNLTVLRNIDLRLHRGEKIALVGLNGAGKSTLIKLLAGLEHPTSGEIRIGEMTSISYFAQYQSDELTATNTVYDELLQNTVAGQGNLARDIGGAFLFHGDEIEKPVSVLSGGEKTRLRIAKMLMGRSNCLLLDEPTNHLDIAARGTLERALQQYEGAFVLVSHDRVFVDRVATKIYEVKDGAVREFFGSYADYVAQLQASGETLSDGQPLPADTRSALKKTQEPSETGNGSRRKSEISPREARKKLHKLEREIGDLEDRVIELEEAMAAIDLRMADPEVYSDGEKMSALTVRKKDLKAALDEALAKWASAEEEADEHRELAEL